MLGCYCYRVPLPPSCSGRDGIHSWIQGGWGPGPDQGQDPQLDPGGWGPGPAQGQDPWGRIWVRIWVRIHVGLGF